MLRKLRFDNLPEDARFIVLLAFIAACFLWGGASRLDVPGLVLLQPAAVLTIAALLLIPGPVRLDAIKAPLLLLIGLATIMALQLIPLPPALWMASPGHAPFAGVARVIGIEQPWRPISITPDLTLASLTGLVVPLAALIGFASLPAERAYRLLPYLILGAALSALLATGQVAGGPQSGLYRYQITNYGAGVGFFSNRNHQAVLLAMAFPMLALWVTSTTGEQGHGSVRKWVATAMAIFLLPMLAVTGSRAGLLLGLAGLGFGWAQLRRHRKAAPKQRRGRFALTIKLAPVVVGIAVLVAAISLSRDEAISRIFASSLSQDPRAGYTTSVMPMVWDFLPTGSGFGSFDPVFRFYEPYADLQSTYLNHAHNDLLELVITGGLPAVLIGLLFLLWAGLHGWRAIRTAGLSRANAFARLGFAIIAIILASSLVDYPLRTPLHAALFAIACGWLAGARSGASARARDGHPQAKDALPYKA